MGPAMSDRATLPELGPALGRLVHPASASPVDRLLAPVRLLLVTRLLEAAGEARRALQGGREPAARAALSPGAWAALWDAAAEQAAAILIRRLDERLLGAAAAARMPAWRADRHRVTDAEHRGIHARLGAGAGALLRSAGELDRAPGPEWAEQVLGTTRRLETAWSALTAAAARELAEWEADIEAVAAWRRPQWPLWTITGAVFAVAVWSGLVLGGYLPVPALLRPAAELVWGRL